MKPIIDLEAAFLDFSHTAESDPNAALDELLCLLLDPVACQARIVLLERLAAEAQRDPELSRPAGHSAIGSQRWEEIVHAVSTLGPVPAFEAEEGPVTLDELDALTWNRKALLKVHRRLCEPLEASVADERSVTIDDALPWNREAPSEVDRRVGEPFEEAKDTPVSAEKDTAAVPLDTRVDLTRLWGDGRLDAIRPHVESCIPLLLDRMGLDRSLASEACECVLDRAKEGSSGSFREAVAGWLLEFGKNQGASPTPLDKMVWREVILRVAVDQVLGSYRTPDDPEHIVDFCQNPAIRQVGDVEEILDVEIEEASPDYHDLEAFKYRLHERLCKEQETLDLVWKMSE